MTYLLLDAPFGLAGRRGVSVSRLRGSSRWSSAPVRRSLARFPRPRLGAELLHPLEAQAEELASVPNGQAHLLDEGARCFSIAVLIGLHPPRRSLPAEPLTLVERRPAGARSTSSARLHRR
jgi:hypothetical protein